MPLGDLQRALGMLVAAGVSARGSSAVGPAPLEDLILTAEERAWLDLLPASPGLKVTCEVARWWRKMRLLWGAWITVATLGAQADPVAEEYLDRTPCSTLFFAAEALGFLDFVLDAGLTVPHLDAVARFERALIRAAEVQARSPTHPPAATLVEFAAPPERILGALLTRAPLPPPQAARYPVIVSPALPQLWRPATPDEILVSTGRQHTAPDSSCGAPSAAFSSGGPEGSPPDDPGRPSTREAAMRCHLGSLLGTGKIAR
jgi:hypothetical protein